MDERRLAEILDAYGADPKRWPEAEREAAERLVETSPAARALRDEAALLDALLDRATEGERAPSADLIERALAGSPAGSEDRAPRRRGSVERLAGARRASRARPARSRARRRLAAFAAPLAAAAAVALWVATEGGPVGTSHVEAPAERYAIADLDDFSVPSDSLLASDGWDVIGRLPELGCSTGELGCPDLSEAGRKRTSRLQPASLRRA